MTSSPNNYKENHTWSHHRKTAKNQSQRVNLKNKQRKKAKKKNRIFISRPVLKKITKEFIWEEGK